MPDSRKTSRPRDPRKDSLAPTASRNPPPLARSLPRPSEAPRRVASLEAELERLRAEREQDVDETAEMLVKIVESERMIVAARSEAVEAGERAGLLHAELERARQRIDELEVEVAGLRRASSGAGPGQGDAHGAIAVALTLLEDLERREEMAASMRARALRSALETLASHAGSAVPTSESTGEAAVEQPASGPESSVEIVGTHELDWDAELGP
jgi:hypothetical protein